MGKQQKKWHCHSNNGRGNWHLYGEWSDAELIFIKMKTLNSKLFEKNQIKKKELRTVRGGEDVWSNSSENADGSTTHEFCDENGAMSYITLRPSKYVPIGH